MMDAPIHLKKMITAFAADYARKNGLPLNSREDLERAAELMLLEHFVDKPEDGLVMITKTENGERFFSVVRSDN